MTAEPPAPLTPSCCDLRDFPRMMIDIQRLLGSEFNALASSNPATSMVGHKLWYRSWHQVPAASLPNADAQLCHLAEMGFDPKPFLKVKTLALRGWVLCSDGRLYHPVVAEVALESWRRKLDQRWKTECARIKKVNQRAGSTVAALPSFEEFIGGQGLSLRTDGDCPRGHQPVSPGTGPGRPHERPPENSIQETGTETEITEEDYSRGESLPLQGSGALAREPSADVEFGRPGGEVVSLRAVTRVEVHEAFEAWNAMAEQVGLPKALQLTDARRKGIRARLSEAGMDGWRRAVSAVAASSYCQGGGDRGWRADLDFVCQPKSFTKLLEGAYAERSSGGARGSRNWSGVDMAVDAYRSGQ